MMPRYTSPPLEVFVCLHTAFTSRIRADFEHGGFHDIAADEALLMPRHPPYAIFYRHYRLSPPPFIDAAADIYAITIIYA